MDLARSTGRTIRLAVVAVLLLLITIHAMAPFSQPLERSNGSAFSAATGDVSLAAPQQADSGKRLVGIAPIPEITPERPLPIQYGEDAGARRTHAWPDATAPPAWPVAASSLAPRAPPAA